MSTPEMFGHPASSISLVVKGPLRTPYVVHAILRGFVGVQFELYVRILFK